MAKVPGAFKPPKGGAYAVKSVAPSRVASHPPVAADGKCRCGRTRPPVARRHEDPFCSSKCCREYYGAAE